MTTTHMRREIAEIPDAVARLIDGSDAALASAGRRLAELDPAFLATVARGSSDHAATYLQYAVELATGLPVASLGPSVASIYGVPLRLSRCACIAISQSGRSPDIVAMADAANRGGALSIALTNTPGSPLAAASALTLDIAAGPERSVAATKTFVNSVVAGLAMIGHWTRDAALLTALRDLPAQLERATDCDWSGVATALAGRDSLFVLGRGLSIAIASEAALKLKETCALHAEAYSSAEVMHGPLELVRAGFPVLALAARDEAEASLAEAADLIAAKGAAAFITSDGARRAVRLPFVATGHRLTDPLALIVSFYVFAEACARARGLDPDQPRNLSKVTETR